MNKRATLTLTMHRNPDQSGDIGGHVFHTVSLSSELNITNHGWTKIGRPETIKVVVEEAGKA